MPKTMRGSWAGAPPLAVDPADSHAYCVRGTSRSTRYYGEKMTPTFVPSTLICMDRMSAVLRVVRHPLLRDVVLTLFVVGGGIAAELSGMRGQTDGIITTRDVIALTV